MKTGGILVIGGGVIGTCVAYYLAERGLSVTLVERGQICPVDGGTYANAGLIVPSDIYPLPAPGVLGHGAGWLLDSKSPFYIRPRPSPRLLRWLCLFASACRAEKVGQAAPILYALEKTSSDLHAQLAAAQGSGYGYAKTGWLSLYTTESVFKKVAQGVPDIRRYGVDVEVLGPEGVLALVPSVTPDIAGGILANEDAHVIPDQFVRAVARLAQSKGATVMPYTEVIDLEASGSRVTRVLTTAGVFAPDTIVLAAGAWSPHLARRLHIGLLVEPAKGYSLTIARPDLSLPLALSLAEQHVGVTPMNGSLRLAGTLELAGFDNRIRWNRVVGIREGVRRVFPAIRNLESAELWRGFRPLTPDGLPLIGRTRQYDNLIVATGHNMNGLSLGPVTGRLVAELVARETPSVDLAPLRPERFGMPGVPSTLRAILPVRNGG